MKTKRKRFWRCNWIENDWDPMGFRYAWCKNEKCPHAQCNCHTVPLMKHCPWFKKADNKGVLLEVTEDDKLEIENFKKNIKRKNDMQEKKVADTGRKYNSMKNKALASELKHFMNGKYEENENNQVAFMKLLNVIVGRLNTL